MDKKLMMLGCVALSAYGLMTGPALASGQPGDAREQVLTVLKRQRELDLAVAPIHSQADLDRYMANTKPEDNPINKLSEAARFRFFAGLKFTERGLAGMDDLDLQNELSASQVYRIMSLFGVQSYIGGMKYLRIDNDVDRALMSQSAVIPFTLPGSNKMECDIEARACFPGPASCFDACDRGPP